MNDSIEKFFDVAKAFCAWAESPPPDNDEYLTSLKLISGLYERALDLPEVQSVSKDLYSDSGAREKSKEIYKRFSSVPFQYYFEVFRPVTKSPEEPVTGDIADDLMDIYIDLKEGVSLYESGKKNDAVFHWKTTFGFHWGRHATSALRALHCYMEDGDVCAN